MKNLIPVFVLFIIFLTVSCGEQSELNEANNEPQPVIEETNVRIDTTVSGSDKIDSILSLSNEELFDTGTLKAEYLDAFLPDNISGYSVIPHSSGKINDGYRIIQSVSAQYTKKGTDKISYITISLKDYGDEGIGGERVTFTNIPEEPGFENQKIQSKNMIGYLIWNPATRDGTVYVLVDDRFVVKIDGYHLSENNPMLLDYLYSLPLKQLIELGNKSNI